MGVSDRREREKERRRLLFIDTAERVFFEQGYEQTTMDQIARAAEFSKRTLYLYFQNKEELFLAIVERGLTILRDLFAEVEEAGSGWVRFINLGRAYFRFAREYPHYYQATMVFENRDYFYGTPTEELGPYGRRCWELNNRNTELAHEAVVRGKEDGTICSPLTPAQLTLLVWSQSSGLIRILESRDAQMEEGYDISSKDLFEQFLQHLAKGIHPGS